MAARGIYTLGAALMTAFCPSSLWTYLDIVFMHLGRILFEDVIMLFFLMFTGKC